MNIQVLLLLHPGDPVYVFFFKIFLEFLPQTFGQKWIQFDY